MSTKIKPPTLPRRPVSCACHRRRSRGSPPHKPLPSRRLRTRSRTPHPNICEQELRPRDRSDEEPAFAEGDAAPVSRLPLRSEDFRERRDTAAKGYTGNGATPPRSITDFETRPRLAGSPATPKAKVFNAFWSGGQRREPPTAAAQAAAAVARALPAGAPAPASQPYSRCGRGARRSTIHCNYPQVRRDRGNGLHALLGWID